MQKTAIGGQFLFATVQRNCKVQEHWPPVQMMRMMTPTNGWFHRSIIIKLMITMKLLTFFLFVSCLSATAAGTAQSITLTGEALPITKVFTAIEKQTGYVALYGPELFDSHTKVSVVASNMPLKAFLDLVFRDQGIKYDIQGKTIFLSRNAKVRHSDNFSIDEIVHLDQTSVRIRVTDPASNPLAGATITNKKTKKTGVTDENGWINLVAQEGDVIVVSYVGFETQSFTVKDAKTTVNIVLNYNAVLDEAVVNVGYQKIKQKYLTGAVTSLRMDSIMQPGLSTVDKMLEGRVPGMMFMQNSGQSGATPQLRIRGTNTFLGSREPLWVVDGIIRTNPFPIPAERINDPDFVNLLGNAISGLNPYDIEQIDVLKDATATALYGVRAANGVIVITTKRGKPGPPSVNYNVTATRTQRPRYTDRGMNMMNSKERINVTRELIAKTISTRGNVILPYEKALFDFYAGRINYETLQVLVDRVETNTDWLGASMRDVVANNHSLSVSGGGATVSYRASLGYRTDPGVIKDEQNKLYTGNLNMQANYRKVKIDFNVQLSKSAKAYTPSEVGLLNYVYGTSRAVPLWNEDGSRYFYPLMGSSVNSLSKELNTMNILNEMETTRHNIDNNQSDVSIDINYEILKGLQFRSKLGYSNAESKQSKYFTENSNFVYNIRRAAFGDFMSSYDPARDELPYGGQLESNFNHSRNYLISGRLNYSNYIDKRALHQINSEIALDILSAEIDSYSNTERGYYRDRGHSFTNIVLASFPTYASWLHNNNTFISKSLHNSIRPFITATYIFKEKYIVTANTNQEFSNSFGDLSNKKFLPTWSISARWNMQEDLFKNTPWVDGIAMLFSFGTRGNMLPEQTPYAIITKGPLDTYYNEFTSTISSLPNPELNWEKVQDYNANIQFSLLQGRINGSVGYFFSRTQNAFLTKKVSAINGVSSYTVNGGTLENQGVEMMLNFKIIDNNQNGKKNRFMWRFDPQLGQVLNRVINNKINSKNVLMDVNSLNYLDYLNGNIPVNGKSVNTFYSYAFKTLSPTNGSPIFYGLEPENRVALRTKYNGMLKEDVFAEVFVESGKREPVVQGSVNNAFVYGSWSLNISFSYSIGNNVRLLKIASGNYGTFRPTSLQNLRREFVDRWQYPGDEAYTNIPALSGDISTLDYDAYAWWRRAANRLNTTVADNYYEMYDYADIRVVKGDYLKLQYASINYRFNAEFCKKLQCKGAMVSLSGNNLFSLAHKELRGQDPSQSGSTPNVNLSVRPVIAFNLNVSF